MLAGKWRGYGAIVNMRKRNGRPVWWSKFDAMTKVDSLANNYRGGVLGCGQKDNDEFGFTTADIESEAWLF